jgi:hypothetical protein
MRYVGNATPHINCKYANVIKIGNNTFNITQGIDMNVFVEVFMMDVPST